MKIWVDKQTGTYGTLDELVFVELDNLFVERDEDGSLITTVHDILGYLENASDSEISEFGEQHGYTVVEDSSSDYLMGPNYSVKRERLPRLTD